MDRRSRRRRARLDDRVAGPGSSAPHHLHGHAGRQGGEDQRLCRQKIVDRVVAVTTATHEGQLFGRLNQAVLVATAASLIPVAISGTIMWWRRRPARVLGARPIAAERGSAPLPAAGIGALALLLPLFGLSLLLVLALDLAVLPRAPRLGRWLGRA